jgi:hypothetical protein
MQLFSYSRSRISLRFFFLFLLIGVCISQSLYAEDDWKLIKNDDGIEVYTRPRKNSNINECKGIVTIPASMNIVCRILANIPLHKKYIHQGYDSFFIKQWEKGHCVHYLAFKTPWPCWNRDLVYDTQAEVNPEQERSVVYSRAVKELLVPYRKNHVRVTNSEHIWILEKISLDKTRVTYKNFSDPGGSVPQFLINIMIVDEPYYSLKNLRDFVIESIKDSSYKTMVCPEVPIKAEGK